MIAKLGRKKLKPANGHSNRIERIETLYKPVMRRVNGGGGGNGHANGNGRTKPGLLASRALSAAAAAASTPAASLETARDPHKVELEIHPYCELLPPLSPEDYDALRNDIIRTWAVRQPIVLLDGKILDGRHKYRIAKIHGVEFRTRDFDPKTEGDPIDWVYSNSLGRNMDQSQKAAAAVQLEECLEAQTKERSARRSQVMSKLAGLSLKQLEAQYPDCYGVLLSREDIIKHIVDKSLGKEPEGSSRDRAGQRYGVSGRYVQDAKLLKEKDPAGFLDVFEGRKKVKVALAKYNERKRTAELDRKSKEAEAALKLDAKRPWTNLCGDALRILPTLDLKVPLIFVDPRYNLGLDYGLGKQFDSTPESVYLNWCREWIVQDAGLLTENGSMYVLIDALHQDKIKTFMEQAGLFWRNTIIMGEGFANHTEDNYQPCARYIHYFCKSRERRVWNGGDILVPNARTAVYGDKRGLSSRGGLKVPGNLWRVAPERAEGEAPSDNVWVEFPRLVGTATARLPGFPTQLDERMVERIIRASSDPGDLVLDHFSGTGTTGAAAIKCGRRYLGIDIVPRNVEWSEKRLVAVAGEMRKAGGR